MNKNFPKILSNIPEGKDLFKAESHRKISNSIISIIENQSNLIDKQIIGLEGDWGTGKSNIIKIIEEEISKRNDLKDKYLHYTFDTWTHQEDLTRKSIIIELINSLRNNIDSFNSSNWIDKEAQLSQKRISKNTKHFPQVKLYYIFLVIGFVIIKFVNEIKKQVINGKLYGYYDNSLNYIKNEFYINFSNSISPTYIYKLVPYLFFLISLILFFKSFYNDYKVNYKKDKKDKSKLTFWGLVGKSFYWISGEKLETNSDETITETEPSNLRFRNFLNDIDYELIAHNKTLILTIDNTDRLTNEKLKSIWSTINIFFAENNNSIFLKNIWLIIPYDSKKVINSFEEEGIGIGLLEKTFAVTFKVPPPLISNWELFFKLCFNKTFDKININEKEHEIEILLKVYENNEKEITPRRIINFINQLATHYIQNPTIQLRYFSIVILKKDILFNGIINENIINRSNYLEKLDTFFMEDDKLELNLAKIIYGVDKDSDAQESLLHNVIEDRLQNNKEFDIDILSLPYFHSYFHKYFKKFIDSAGMEGSTNDIYFDKVTNILNNLEPYFIKENKKSIYCDLWEYYYKRIIKNRFTVFNETVIGVCNNCSRKSKIELINKSLISIAGNLSNEINVFPKEKQILYIDFLKNINSFISKNKSFSFKDLNIAEQEVLPELAIECIRNDKELYKKTKLKPTIDDLKRFLTDDPFDNHLSSSKLFEYRDELSFLNQIEKLDFIVSEINTKWNNQPLTSIAEIETLILYSTLYDEINIDKISNITFSSIIDLIVLANKNVDLSNAFLLIFINYDSTKTNSILNKFREALKRFDVSISQNVSRKVINHKPFQKLYNFLDLAIKFNDIKSINDFTVSFLKENKLKLDEESFNLMLENYTILNSKIIDTEVFNLIDYLNNNSKNYQINISNIDAEIIVKSNKFLKIEIIDKANKYLLSNIESNKSFLENTSSKEYKLFEKLLDLDRIDIAFFNENFIHSFVNLGFKNFSIQISDETIIKIKSFIDVNILKSQINLKLRAIRSYNNIYILSPEIFWFFDKLMSSHKHRILEILVNKINFYDENLFNQVMISQNTSLINTLKSNIFNHSDIHLKELAIKKGIIDPIP
ncbi:MAG TPA: P-loop NTPase fold protein [Flavobacterium sp.]|uniref:P-loop NTPase fold protein n=1 Tax=unclassified Flavobacterium TaxID=196869 RepID=UPI0025C1B60E|nr:MULTISPECIES: P-loop NTPase fold protein [unclassified Flavobacterium]HRE78476.1 P-loop NTPase fold protein [Flavobacterium sp.]